MDVNISGRHINVTDEVREAVTQQLSETIDKLKGNVIRADVEFNGVESGSDKGVRVEITLRGKGPVVRAAGSAAEKLIAFDVALEHLRAQLRKAADRRKSHRGLRVQEFAEAFAPIPTPAPAVVATTATTLTPSATTIPPNEPPDTRTIAGIAVEGDGPLVVREKSFTSAPLTLEQALDEMELVGHDFFLYVDAVTGAPSVVYRRKAYDYGVLHLKVSA
ncbi:MAG: ribosome-associated translation inhibitor RaiA [Propionibacteriaceae bacterium]|jgi:ribosomal subunit interface protein|nr:ribosome-associated translation inhibitor RaiA [Propionibacteriaceae bacterium]